ncbi:zinc-ribbon domain-containing protein [Streptomyces sp. NPDC058953]|uniref:zinc-ribbon domain-containing protein n=1 Tax=unclassified Streptomyces TaxID=2593676 RepID=UPI00368A1BAD
MIIFGTKGYLYQLAIVTLVCGHCGNPAAHTLRKRVTKFTLFFVPLFPFSTKYGTQCTFCGAESQLDQQQADALQAQAATGAVPGGAPGGAPGYGGAQQANPFASGNPFQQGGGQGQSGNPYQR